MWGLGVLKLTCSTSVPWFCSRIQWPGWKSLWEPGYQQVQYWRVYDFRQCWNISAPTMIPHLKGIQWCFLIFTSLSCSNLTDINQILGVGTSLVVQWLRLCTPNARGLDSLSGRETRSHVLQRRVLEVQLKDNHMPQWRSEIPCATAKTQCTQIKKWKEYLKNLGYRYPYPKCKQCLKFTNTALPSLWLKNYLIADRLIHLDLPGFRGLSPSIQHRVLFYIKWRGWSLRVLWLFFLPISARAFS